MVWKSTMRFMAGKDEKLLKIPITIVSFMRVCYYG